MARIRRYIGRYCWVWRKSSTAPVKGMISYAPATHTVIVRDRGYLPISIDLEDIKGVIAI